MHVAAVLAAVVGGGRLAPEAAPGRGAPLRPLLLRWSGQKNFGYLVVATFPLVLRGWGLLLPGIRPQRVAGATLAASALRGCLFLNGFVFAQERVPHRFGHAFNARMPPCAPAPSQGEGAAGPADEHARGWRLRRVRHRAPSVHRRPQRGDRARFLRRVPAHAGRGRLRPALARWQPQIVLVPFNQVAAWFFHLDRDRANWRCVYLDELSAVFLRNDFAPEILAVGPLPYPRFTEAETDAILAQARRPRGVPSMADPHRPHDYPLDAMQWTTLALLRGEDVAAVAHGVDGIRRATVPVPDLWHNLGLAFPPDRPPPPAAPPPPPRPRDGTPAGARPTSGGGPRGGGGGRRRREAAAAPFP